MLLSQDGYKRGWTRCLIRAILAGWTWNLMSLILDPRCIADCLSEEQTVLIGREAAWLMGDLCPRGATGAVAENQNLGRRQARQDSVGTSDFGNASPDQAMRLPCNSKRQYDFCNSTRQNDLRNSTQRNNRCVHYAVQRTLWPLHTRILNNCVSRFAS